MPDEIGTPVEGAASPEAAAPAADPLGPLSDRLSELAGTIDTRLGEFEQRLPQPETPAEADPWADLFGSGDDTDEYGNPVQPQQPALDPQALQNAIQAAIQQQNAPLAAELQELRQARARDQLIRDIPQLADPAVAGETEQAFMQFLQTANTPPEIASWLVNSPDYIGQFFKAAEATKLAAGQAPAGGEVPQLESAGGAVPSGNGEQPSYVQSAHDGGWQGLPKGLR